jgi:hypothetical protein
VPFVSSFENTCGVLEKWGLASVIPAKAGIQARADTQVRPYGKNLDSRVRGNDEPKSIKSPHFHSLEACAKHMKHFVVKYSHRKER